MVSILVFDTTKNPGGIESFLISCYRHIGRRKIHCGFLCN